MRSVRVTAIAVALGALAVPFSARASWAPSEPRFLDEVPGPNLANPASLNPWLYANGNPLKYKDPNGEAACLGNSDECRSMFDQARRMKSAVSTFSAETVVQSEGAMLSIAPMGGFERLEFINPSDLGAASLWAVAGDGLPYSTVGASTLDQLVGFFETLNEGMFTPARLSNEAFTGGFIRGAMLQQPGAIPNLLDPMALLSVEPRMLGMSQQEVYGVLGMAGSYNDFIAKMYQAGGITGVGANLALIASGLSETSAAVQAEASASRGYVSGFSELLKKSHAAAAGDTGAAAEIRAIKALRAEGLNVHMRTAASDLGIQSVRTSDILVGGARGTGMGGVPMEIYSPLTSNTGRVVGQLAKKLPQSDRFVIDLDQTGLNVSDLGNLRARVSGVPGVPQPLQSVIFVKNGRVVGTSP